MSGLVQVPAWELQEFLVNAAAWMRQTMAMIGIIFGIIMLVWGAIVIGKGLMSSGQQPVPWMKGLALIVLGGVLAFGTWNTLYQSVGKGMNTTITNMGDKKGQDAKPETVLAGFLR